MRETGSVATRSWTLHGRRHQLTAGFFDRDVSRTGDGQAQACCQRLHHLVHRLVLSREGGLDVRVRSVCNLDEPLFRKSVPALLDRLVVRSLRAGKVTDDNVEVTRYAAEEARKLLEQLRREEEEVFRAAAIGGKLLGEVARVVEHLVVALGNDLARRLEQAEEMVGLEDERAANLVVL